MHDHTLPAHALVPESDGTEAVQSGRRPVAPSRAATSSCPAITCWSPSARRLIPRSCRRAPASKSAPGADCWSIPQTLATGAPGVFAAGDVTYGPKTIIHAAAHGRLAARSIHAYLRSSHRRRSPRCPRTSRDGLEICRRMAWSPSICGQPREESCRSVRERRRRDRSVEFVDGFSEEQARAEASRCLRCDLAYLCPTVKLVTGTTQVGEHRTADASVAGTAVEIPTQTN